MLFHFMDMLPNFDRMELERKKIMTIDETITQTEALIDFRHENSDKAERKERKGSCDHSEGDHRNVKKEWLYRKNDTYKSEDKIFRR